MGMRRPQVAEIRSRFRETLIIDGQNALAGRLMPQRPEGGG
jgi:hypothetical protein